MYETVGLEYQKTHTYLPDFPLREKVFIEVKGYFTAIDRAKHLEIKRQFPDVKIYFLFQNSKNKLHKHSKLTYADWCKKHGFEYSDEKQGIPKEWFDGS